MNEEVFNRDIRKFLKKVGISSQREIETAVAAAVASGTLQPTQSLRVSVLLQLPELGISLPIEGDIALQ